MEKQCSKMVENGPVMQFEVQYQAFLLFNQTCRYLSTLIDSIISCNMNVPYDSQQRVTELTNSLATFLKYSKTNDANSSTALKNNCSSSSLNKTQISGDSVPHKLLTSQVTKMKEDGVILQDNVPVALKTDWNDMATESTAPDSLLENTCKTADKDPIPKPLSPKTKNPQSTSSQNQHQVPNIKAQESNKSGNNSANNLHSKESKGNVKQIELIVEVTKPFQALIKKLLKGKVLSIENDIYCRLCDIFCDKGWKTHLKHWFHCQMYKSNKEYDLTMFTCSICNLVIYGERDLILKYLYFHFTKIHQDQETADWDRSYYEVDHSKIEDNSNGSYPRVETILTDKRFNRRETQGGNGGPSAKSRNTPPSASPRKKERIFKNKNYSSKTDLPSSVSSSKADLSSPVSNSKMDLSSPFSSSKTDLSSPFSSSKANLSSPVSNSKMDPSSPVSDSKTNLSSPISSSNVMCANTDLATNISPDNTLHIEFNNLVKGMLENWEKKALLTESGFCDVCKVGCSSYFSWFDHMERHNDDKNPQWSELKCIHCPLRIYGTNHDQYFKSPIHQLIDKIAKK